jgi:hypothetical protein
VIWFIDLMRHVSEHVGESEHVSEHVDEHLAKSEHVNAHVSEHVG